MAILDNFNIQVCVKSCNKCLLLVPQQISDLDCSYDSERMITFLSPTKVNNPVTILTQEMSKYFLHSKGGAEKYKVI